MARIKVKNEVEVYEVNGEKTRAVGHPKLEVRSHWNDCGMVVLRFGDGEVTVAARDLEAAVKNATNTVRI